MKLNNETAEIFVPDHTSVIGALKRTTHLAIGAHQDDLETIAVTPILECFKKDDLWFTGVVVADGRGSPRNGLYQDYSDEEMRHVRFEEQRKAAVIGEYGALIMLDYSSAEIKNGKNASVVNDLANILRTSQPNIVFTHNLADKHDTHIGVGLRTIEAIRQLEYSQRPLKLYGCEDWRGLDWMNDEEKVCFDVSMQKNLQAALIGIFDSQISGGKRYDLAIEARHRANATLFDPHSVDEFTDLAFAMDLTPLIQDDLLDPFEFIQSHIEHFMQDVGNRIKRMQKNYDI